MVGNLSPHYPVVRCTRSKRAEQGKLNYRGPLRPAPIRSDPVYLYNHRYTPCHLLHTRGVAPWSREERERAGLGVRPARQPGAPTRLSDGARLGWWNFAWEVLSLGFVPIEHASRTALGAINPITHFALTSLCRSSLCGVRVGSLSQKTFSMTPPSSSCCSPSPALQQPLPAAVSLPVASSGG